MSNQGLINLVNHLKETEVLKNPKIIEAFLRIDRKDFVPGDIKDLAYIDEALPIGQGQTISQPYTVAFMLELLEPRAGEKIMDIGAGSGWQTAILAHVVSQPLAGKAGKSGKTSDVGKKTSDVEEDFPVGRVYAIERAPALCGFGKSNAAKYNFISQGIVEWFCKDASDGLPEVAKKISGFDKIVAAASLQSEGSAASAIPLAWKKQLKTGGRIVAPIGGSIWLFVKKSEDNFEEEEHPGFAFVPFVKDKNL